MSRRNWLILIGLVMPLLAVELGVWFTRQPRGCLRLVNQGTTPIEGLSVSFDANEVAVDRLGAGEAATVWLDGGRQGTLSLSFQQRGNPMKGLQVPDFNPREMSRNGLKLVLEIRTNEVTRYMEEREPSTPLSRLGARLLGWLAAELGIAH